MVKLTSVPLWIKSTLFALLLIGSAPSIAEDEFNTLDLFTDSFDADFESCVDLQVKGACEWIRCTLFGCDFDTTTIIEHYTPDVVVSVYDDLGNSPYSDSDMFTGVISSLLGRNSNGGAKAAKNRPSNVVSRHADIYGSAAALGLINLLEQLPLGLACEPGSTPLKPYFVSSSNPLLWYTGLIDSLMNLDQRLSTRHVVERQDGVQGSFITTAPFWGNVFPRTGMVVQQDEYRASTVFAVRAVDILMNGNSFGLYRTELDGSEGRYYEPSDKFEEWSSHEGRFQMLYPTYENTCHIMADVAEKSNTLDGWEDKRSTDGDYAWHYWRRYKCCKRPSGYTLLFKVEW